MTLHEAARKYGVEVGSFQWVKFDDDSAPQKRVWIQRPDLNIAHDILAKLPASTEDVYHSLSHVDGERWYWQHTTADEDLSGILSFIEAVLALAERALGT